MYKFLQSLETRRFRGLFHFRANGQPLGIVDWLVKLKKLLPVIVDASKFARCRQLPYLPQTAQKPFIETAAQKPTDSSVGFCAASTSFYI